MDPQDHVYYLASVQSFFFFFFLFFFSFAVPVLCWITSESFHNLFPFIFLPHFLPTFNPTFVVMITGFRLKKHGRFLALFPGGYSAGILYRDMLKGIERNVPSWPLLQELGVMGSTRRNACREWVSSCALPNQHLILLLLETEDWAGWTLQGISCGP